MRDQFGRSIGYMRVSVTDRCNLRCVYCMPAEGVPCVSHSDILTFDEITRICRIASSVGISRIKLTGGEPLVRRGLPDLLRMIKEISGIEQVTLTTNGILLRDRIKELAANGLDGVNISIDTLNPERYADITRGGNLKEALAGLEAALSYPELTVRINCVPMEDVPMEEYIRLAVLAKERNLDVRFIEMMPIGLGRKFAGVSGDEVCERLAEAFGRPAECTGRFGNGPAVYAHFPGFRGKIGFIDAVSHQFCDTCNRVRLTSEGVLKPCLQYGTGADLRKLLRSGADDEAIRHEMCRTIYEKPACHHFSACTSSAEQITDSFSDAGQTDAGQTDAGISGQTFETRDMSQIGG